MRVLKFGGSSLADETRIRRVGDIVAASAQKGRIAVVLSAMKGITDSLIACGRLAEGGSPEYRDSLAAIRDRHLEAAARLLPETEQARALTALGALLDELADILHGVQLLKECSDLSLNLIMSFGERLICTLFPLYLASRGIPAETVDAREIILTETAHGITTVIADTYEKIRGKLAGLQGVAVITGFIASTQNGKTTTLGRNGSDYTASLIGAGMRAEAIEIWTDVDGVLSADPASVKNVYVIPNLSYEEAMELSYFGAKVIHPYTMIPATRARIPILIKNTFRPEQPGTLIAAEASPKKKLITGIASIEHMALVNVEGGGMLGVPGIASRILTALARANVNITMISQASSEHTICLIFRDTEIPKVQAALAEELKQEIENQRIQEFEIIKNLAVIAVIGESMRGTPGISGRLFSSLGRAGINVLAIAQGSSERNISIATERKDMERALNAIHGAFLEEA